MGVPPLLVLRPTTKAFFWGAEGPSPGRRERVPEGGGEGIGKYWIFNGNPHPAVTLRPTHLPPKKGGDKERRRRTDGTSYRSTMESAHTTMAQIRIASRGIRKNSRGLPSTTQRMAMETGQAEAGHFPGISPFAALFSFCGHTPIGDAVTDPL